MGKMVRRPLTNERMHSMVYFIGKTNIDGRNPGYVQDMIRERLRMNHRISYIAMILHW